MAYRGKRSRDTHFIAPDEIFLDSSNLPLFDTQQLEGRLEKPINKKIFYFLFSFFALGLVIFLTRIFNLQIIQGEAYAERGESNTLKHVIISPERGPIYDRNGIALAWNAPERQYSSNPGTAIVLGYLGYPNSNEDLHLYSPQELIGRDGVERVFNNILRGQTGVKIEETNVQGEIQSEYLFSPPRSGEKVILSIDLELQEKLFELIKDLSKERGFVGGAGVLMDVRTGELISLVSYPEYDANLLTKGKDREAINELLKEKNNPFLNRVTSGLYAPGSVIKPIIAVAALNEGIIEPETEILSTGSISLPNPFFPDQPSIFRDWKAHGLVDLRRALAVSSDVYFYEIGGGFKSQIGLGISNIEKYSKLFGFGIPTGINWPHEESGVIPSPEWKEKNFPGDIWRVGNTYHTAIGQYGFQVTPLQMVRAIAAIATDGQLLTPTILSAKTNLLKQPARDLSLNISDKNFEIVREGMRLAVTEGTASGLNVGSVKVAAKTGTAELGTTKNNVNSWVVGYFPYDNPHYAFAVVMERGHHENMIGGVFIMRQFIDWLGITKPEYLK